MKWLQGLKSSLRKQIIITSLLCLVIPVGAIIVLSSLFTIHLIKGRVVQTASESLQVTGAHMTNIMDNMIRITNNIQFDVEMKSLLKNPKSEGSKLIEMQKKVEEKLDPLVSNSPGTYITILLPGSSYYSNYSFYEYNPIRFKSELWYPSLEQMDTFDTLWVGVHPTYIQSEGGRNPYMVTVARALRDVSSEPYAYVIVSVNELQLRSIITKYSESQNIMLLSNEGKIISGLDRIGETYSQFEELNKSAENSLITFGGEEQILVKHNLPLAGWMLVSLTPYMKATSPIYALFQSNFLLEIGFVILFLFILIYLLRRFTKPIIRLVQVANSIEAGNLAVRSNIKGPDEFVKLGRSIDHMLDSIRSMVKQITYEQEMKRRAELAMLQAQINPHFLFNILNAIRLKIMLRGDREHASIIRSLTHLLRQTINNEHEFVHLQDEVGIVEDYMKLMCFTSKNLFQYEIDLSSETLHEMVPRFILQPIIENALIHGLKQNEGVIRIQAWKEKEKLLICIQDDGNGMTTNELEGLRKKLLFGFRSSYVQEENRKGMHGIGLINVYERLSLVYGGHFQMDLESQPGKGTVVKLFIPERGRNANVESDSRR